MEFKACLPIDNRFWQSVPTVDVRNSRNHLGCRKPSSQDKLSMNSCFAVFLPSIGYYKTINQRIYIYITKLTESPAPGDGFSVSSRNSLRNVCWSFFKVPECAGNFDTLMMRLKRTSLCLIPIQSADGWKRIWLIGGVESVFLSKLPMVNLWSTRGPLEWFRGQFARPIQ